MALRPGVAARPMTAAVLFEGGLVPVALVLGVLAGVEPWRDFGFSPALPLWAVVATAPLVAALAACAAAPTDWFRETERLVRPLVEVLFRGRGWLAVVGVSALAGLGEELLFRGVVQSWLGRGLGEWAGLLVAAAIFGLAHALSRAYFVMATVMGLYLGALYQSTGNLLLPALVHALYDGIAIGYLLRTGSAAPDTADGE